MNDHTLSDDEFWAFAEFCDEIAEPALRQPYILGEQLEQWNHAEGYPVFEPEIVESLRGKLLRMEPDQIEALAGRAEDAIDRNAVELFGTAWEKAEFFGEERRS